MWGYKYRERGFCAESREIERGDKLQTVAGRGRAECVGTVV